MAGRIATMMLAGAIVTLGPIGAAIASHDGSARDEIMTKKEQDGDEVATRADDDDDRERGDTDTGSDTNSSFSSGVNSNDGTNSRKTGVSRNRDRSRGDLTRDRTKDGPGTSKRDWSKHQTNDRSKNDTR